MITIPAMNIAGTPKKNSKLKIYTPVNRLIISQTNPPAAVIGLLVMVVWFRVLRLPVNEFRLPSLITVSRLFFISTPSMFTKVTPNTSPSRYCPAIKLKDVAYMKRIIIRDFSINYFTWDNTKKVVNTKLIAAPIQ